MTISKQSDTVSETKCNITLDFVKSKLLDAEVKFKNNKKDKSRLYQKEKYASIVATKDESFLWHRRLGHGNRRGLKLLGPPQSEKTCSS